MTSLLPGFIRIYVRVNTDRPTTVKQRERLLYALDAGVADVVFGVCRLDQDAVLTFGYLSGAYRSPAAELDCRPTLVAQRRANPVPVASCQYARDANSLPRLLVPARVGLYVGAGPAGG